MHDAKAVNRHRTNGNPPDPAVIFLVNPISNEGHLDTYARFYSGVLLNLGYRVVLVAQKDIGCREWLGRRQISTGRFAEFQPRMKESQDGGEVYRSKYTGGLLARAWAHYRETGLKASLKKIGTYLSCRWLAPGYLAIRKAVATGLDSRPLVKKALARIFSRFLDSNKSHFIAALDAWVSQAENVTGFKPDLVFILYADILDQSLKAWRHWQHPWACIRFAPRLGDWQPQGAVEPFFTLSSFRGACMLNADSTAVYKQRLPRATFTTAPDVCDIDFPVSECRLVTDLRRKVKGRTLVFAGGGLTSRKGIYDLLRAIPGMNPREYFFAFIGKVYWTTFSRKEIAALMALQENPPENVFVHFGYLEDERDFNAIIEAADIIYAVYRDFPYSSNLLSKAAYLKKPLLVSERYVMGKQVSLYGLGLAVPEQDVPAIREALERLRDYSVETGVRDYCDLHSQEMLELSLDGFLRECLEKEATDRAERPEKTDRT